MTDEQKRDARLVHQILSGDEDAFAELNALYKQRIYEFIASKIVEFGKTFNKWHDDLKALTEERLKLSDELDALRHDSETLKRIYGDPAELKRYREQLCEWKEKLDDWQDRKRESRPGGRSYRRGELHT